MHKSVSTILFEVVKQEINKTIPGLYFYNTKLLFIGFFLYVINISLLFLIIIFANISCSKICIRVFWMAIITRRVDTIFITGIFNRCLVAFSFCFCFCSSFSFFGGQCSASGLCVDDMAS